MPKYRKRRARKRPFRRYRRKRYNRKKRTSAKTGFLQIWQKCSRLEAIPSEPLGVGAGSFHAWTDTFTLSDIATANSTALQRLFKMWRIKKVIYTITPKYLGQGILANEPQPQMMCSGVAMTSITLDSNFLPPTTATWSNVYAAEESGNLKKSFLNLNSGRYNHTVVIKPRLNSWVRTDPASQNNTVALAKSGTWISTGTPGTQYYGVRAAFENNSAHPAFDIEVRKSYLIEFRGLN